MPKHIASKEYLTLKKVTPEQWLKRVMQVPQTCRTEIAHIIWWDYFGGAECAARMPHLDSFLKRPKWNNPAPTDEQLIKALMQCGYSQGKATQRIINKIPNK